MAFIGITVAALVFDDAAAQEPSPPQLETMPRPEWQAPGPLMSEEPGAQMPEADPFQLLENSPQVHDDLHLSKEQLSRIAVASRLFRTKLLELSYPRPGVSKEAAQLEIQRHVMETRNVIARELTPPQLVRLQQIMLQLQGPCQAAVDPEIARQLGIGRDQARAIRDACRDRAVQMRNALEKPNSREDFCKVMMSNRTRIEQIRTSANERILDLLSPEQRAMFDRMTGKRLALDPPVPPDCR